MPNDSKITTELAVDDPLAQDADFAFGPDDRQFLDNQARGIQKHLVAALIRGRHASYFRLAGSSASVAAGDCVVDVAQANITEPTVTRAVTAAFANVISPIGVVLQAAAPGGFVLVAFGGMLPPSLTGLSATSGYARVNGSTAKCEQVATLSPGDMGIGTISASGWLQVAPAVSSFSGGASGSNLGGAPLQVFKDNVGGALRHRTMRVALDSMPAVPSSQQDPSGYDGEVWIRPLPPGHVNIVDYGAVPSNQDGTGTITDCTAALAAAIAAVTTNRSTTNQHGVVYIPPAPVGQEWYFAGATNDQCPMRHIEISRAVRIVGTSTGRSGRGGSRVKLGPLCAGFRFVEQSMSSDGGDGGGAAVEGLDIYGTRIGALTGANAIALGWQAAHAYSVGDKIRPFRVHHLYYECIKAGTSNGPAPGIGVCSQYATTSYPIAGNRWRPGHTYSPGDAIHTNTQCGWTYVCTVGGTTRGQVFGGGPQIGEATTEVDPGTNKRGNIGEPDWFDNADSPRTSAFASVAEVDGPTWAKDAADPEPIWDVDGVDGYGAEPCLAQAFQPNHSYHNGAQVFATGRFDVIFVANISDYHTPQTSGGSEPAAFATANPGDAGIVDGGITWQPIAPIGVVNDGTVVWAARSAGAFLVNASSCKIAHCYIQDTPTAAIALTSFIATGASFLADFTKVTGPSTIIGCGVCIYAKGGDANAGTFENILMFGDAADYWLDPADHAVLDKSLLGNHYRSCVIQGASGYGIATLGGASSGTIASSYFEGIGRKTPIGGNSQVLGGTIASNLFRHSSIDANGNLSTSGPSFFADMAIGAKVVTHPETQPGMTVIRSLQNGRDSALSFSAENVEGLGGGDLNGYQLRYNALASGWWTFTNPGNGYYAFSLSGASADIGAGHPWFLRGYLIGQTDKHYHFSDRDNAGDEYITLVGGMRKGDIVDRADTADAVGRFYHNVNIAPTEGAHYGFDWVSGATYAVGTIVVPTQLKQTANHRAFQVQSITTGVSGGAEPAWPDTLGATITDGGVTWVAIKGPLMARASQIESGLSKSVDISGGDVTLLLTDDYATVTTGGAHSVLLSASPFEGKWHSVKNRTGGAVTVDGNTKNIDGAATFSLVDKGTILVRYNAATGEWEIR